MKKSALIDLESLVKNEGWEITLVENQKKILAHGKTFNLLHPYAIYCSLYRNESNPEMKFFFMKKIHDFLWPDQIPTWNYWSEERFRAHCEGHSFISYAGGASTGKSLDAAKIACIMWLSDPGNNAVIVASTTLQALSKRIWGYIVRFMHKAKIPIQFTYTKHPSPQMVFDPKDEIHSMSAMAAGVGTDSESIRNYIGRHPNKKFMLVLDEATDLSPDVLKAVANLEAGEEGKLQVVVIGNSLSKSDLHGALSTPKAGWRTVDWKTHTRWQTTQKNGICLYFSPFNSPAIHETDPEKKALLSKFFVTLSQIEEKRAHYGENSPDYFRFILGWWQDNAGSDTTFTSEPFLNNYAITRKALWSGLHPLVKVAGFDPAFSTGGDSAILRIGVMGHESNGRVVIDFKGEELCYKLKMMVVHKDDIDIQLADQIIDILLKENCFLENVAFDCTGQGRAFASLVRLQAAKRGYQFKDPVKIWHSRSSGTKNNQPTMIVKTPTELWDNVKEFVQTGQIAGMDAMALYQFTTRMLVVNPKTKKRELENKQDYKNRMGAINPGKGSSPDQADALALATFAAVYRHGFHLEQMKSTREEMGFHEKKYQAFQQMEVKPESETRTIGLGQIKLGADFRGELGVKIRGPLG